MCIRYNLDNCGGGGRNILCPATRDTFADYQSGEFYLGDVFISAPGARNMASCTFGEIFSNVPRIFDTNSKTIVEDIFRSSIIFVFGVFCMYKSLISTSFQKTVVINVSWNRCTGNRCKF